METVLNLNMLPDKVTKGTIRFAEDCGDEPIDRPLSIYIPKVRIPADTARVTLTLTFHIELRSTQ